MDNTSRSHCIHWPEVEAAVILAHRLFLDKPGMQNDKFTEIFI